MTVEIVDGLRIIKLHDKPHNGAPDADTLTMMHLWRLLSGGHGLRDHSVFGRHYL